ncbi:MAG: class I SAM-dependent methyltransferase [Bacteroidales bacterium]|nr:class I SAM-dependent methyltransferase [Bacteroidales bacterium]
MDLIRKNIQQSDDLVTIKEMGAGSIHMNTTRKLKHILQRSSVKDKYGYVLHQVIKKYAPGKILEIGSSIGISACWMAMANKGTSVISLEGNSSLIKYACKYANKLDLKNIEWIEGNFDGTLPNVLRDNPDYNIAFIDGNHTYEATMRYYSLLKAGSNELRMIIFDDIYWSKEMTRAWKEIKKDDWSHVSIDLYQLGIILHNHTITPGHYRIRY